MRLFLSCGASCIMFHAYVYCAKQLRSEALALTWLRRCILMRHIRHTTNRAVATYRHTTLGMGRSDRWSLGTKPDNSWEVHTGDNDDLGFESRFPHWCSLRLQMQQKQPLCTRQPSLHSQRGSVNNEALVHPPRLRLLHQDVNACDNTPPRIHRGHDDDGRIEIWTPRVRNRATWALSCCLAETEGSSEVAEVQLVRHPVGVGVGREQGLAAFPHTNAPRMIRAALAEGLLVPVKRPTSHGKRWRPHPIWTRCWWV